jgi:hypothetical protein
MKLNQTINDGEVWEEELQITIDQLGTNRIIFELFIKNATSSKYDYTGNWVNLSVEAIEAP